MNSCSFRFVYQVLLFLYVPCVVTSINLNNDLHINFLCTFFSFLDPFIYLQLLSLGPAQSLFCHVFNLNSSRYCLSLSNALTTACSQSVKLLSCFFFNALYESYLFKKCQLIKFSSITKTVNTFVLH